jgi:hypothetical protein
MTSGSEAMMQYITAAPTWAGIVEHARTTLLHLANGGEFDNL